MIIDTVDWFQVAALGSLLGGLGVVPLCVASVAVKAEQKKWWVAIVVGGIIGSVLATMGVFLFEAFDLACSSAALHVPPLRPSSLTFWLLAKTVGLLEVSVGVLISGLVISQLKRGACRMAYSTAVVYCLLVTVGLILLLTLGGYGHEDTEFSPYFSFRRFKSLRVRCLRQDVEHRLGRPLATDVGSNGVLVLTYAQPYRAGWNVRVHINSQDQMLTKMELFWTD